MKRSGRTAPIVSAAGLVALIIGVNLMYTSYSLLGFVLVLLGGVTMVIGLVLTLSANALRRRQEPKTKYGRYDSGSPPGH